MICELQRFPWRRVTVDYGPLNPLAVLLVHAVIIGKSIPVVPTPTAMRNMSQLSADGIAALLVQDFAEALSEQKEQPEHC
jgi:hypothetical protein